MPEDRVAPQSVECSDEHERRINHDIQHQLGTVKLLAALLSTADDVGRRSRQRAKDLVIELAWLERFVRSARNATLGLRPDERLIRLDVLVADILETARVTGCTLVDARLVPALVDADPLALGRALRNLVWNAFDAAGPAGTVLVRMATGPDAVLVEIADDGRGAGASVGAGSGLGLEIVHDAVVACGGRVEVAAAGPGSGAGGGYTTRLTFPLATGGC